MVDTLNDTVTVVSESELRGMLEHGNVINGVCLQGGMLSYYDWRKANLLKSSALITGLDVVDGKLMAVGEDYPYSTIDLNMYGEPCSSFYIKKGGLVIHPIKSALMQFNIYADCRYTIDLSGLTPLYAIPYIGAIRRGMSISDLSDLISTISHLMTSYTGVGRDLCIMYGILSDLIGKNVLTLGVSIDSVYCFIHTYLSDLYNECIKATDLTSFIETFHREGYSGTSIPSNLSHIVETFYTPYPYMRLYLRYLRNAIKAYGYTKELNALATNFIKLVK